MKIGVALLVAGVSLFAVQPCLASVYQTRINLTCSADVCSGAAAAVPVGKTLDIATISCNVLFSATPTLGVGQLYVFNHADGFNQFFSINTMVNLRSVAPAQSAPYSFGAGKRPAVDLIVGSSSAATASCNLAGLLTP